MILENKRTVVTGAASGIGAGTARAFAREGARVAVLDRDVNGAAKVAGELAEPPAGPHLAGEVDVASPESIDAAFAEVDAAFGGVDVLVNCAGVRGTGSPLEATLEEWRFVIDVNLTGSFYCAQLAARRMAEAGTGGSIVNIASTAGILAVNQRTAYCASKAGVIGLTKSLALDLGELGIRVNAICPGLTRTGLTAPYYEDAGWVEQVESDIPLRRSGQPADLAEAITFLASDHSAYVTGVSIPVDGGMSATRPLGGGGTAFSAKRAA
ncbi:MAG: SDR family oxidoreductase [Actinobacteria bacterium]|nr:SDR family oxidoreductase [Actinomycetota bacterium]